MGMSESVYANCPKCGHRCEFQTEATVSQSVYESAVKGRQDFRNAYRKLLPVLRAGEKLSRLWRTHGRRVDVTEYWDAINEVDVAVCGGHAKPEYISEREDITEEADHASR